MQNMAEKHILGFPVVFSSQRSSALFVPSGHTVKLDFPKPDISFFSSLHFMELGALAALKLLVVVARRLGRTRLSLHLDGQAVELGEDTARPQTPCTLEKDQIHWVWLKTWWFIVLRGVFVVVQLEANISSLWRWLQSLSQPKDILEKFSCY